MVTVFFFFVIACISFLLCRLRLLTLRSIAGRIVFDVYQVIQRDHKVSFIKLLLLFIYSVPFSYSVVVVLHSEQRVESLSESAEGRRAPLYDHQGTGMSGVSVLVHFFFLSFSSLTLSILEFSYSLYFITLSLL
jgi:hypothetical protein